MQSTRTHTERARPAAAAFFRFFFRYTPCFRIYFSYSPLYVREKIKKKPKNRCFFFNRNFMRNMFAALLAQNFFSSSFFSTVFFSNKSMTLFSFRLVFFFVGVFASSLSFFLSRRSLLYSTFALHLSVRCCCCCFFTRNTSLAAAFAIGFSFIFVHFRLLRFRSNYFRCSRTLGTHTL